MLNESGPQVCRHPGGATKDQLRPAIGGMFDALTPARTVVGLRYEPWHVIDRDPQIVGSDGVYGGDVNGNRDAVQRRRRDRLPAPTPVRGDLQ